MKNECKIMENLKNESYERGTKRAEFNVAARYYRMGLISLKEAAEDTGMQLEEFAIEVAKISSYNIRAAVQPFVRKGIQ